MQKNKLYDITEVCRMLAITSRTLRFYEEKGIIQSTVEPYSSRRRYTTAQIDRIRQVLILRTLGIPIKAIADLQKNGTDLQTVILARRGEIYATLEKKTRELYLLNEAISVMEAGGDIGNVTLDQAPPTAQERGEIAGLCARAIVTGDTDTLYTYFSPRMEKRMPKAVYEEVRAEALLPLGEFLAYEKEETDPLYPSRMHWYVRYTSMGLRITLVLHNKRIDGMWLTYYDTKEKELI